MLRATASALLVDVVLVVAFAATGRASHDSDVLAGLAQTSWPFLVALLVGWAAVRGWRAPTAPIRTGLGLWAITVVGGMLLRLTSAQGTALPFVLVASVTLFVLLVGWRAVVHGIRSLRAHRRLAARVGPRA